MILKQKALLRGFQPIYKKFNEALASFENVGAAIIGLSPSGEIVYVNQSACELLGYLKEELEGSLLGTIAPEISAEAWSSFWSGLDPKDSEPVIPILRQSGKKELSIKFKALFIEQSGLKYCMLMDPEQSRAAAVWEGAHGLPLVLDRMTDHAVVLDDQHKIVYLNRTACQSLGTTVAEAAGKTVYDYMPKKEADIGWEHEQYALDSMRPSTRVGDGFLRAKYGESVTMLPFLDPRTSQKRLLVIVHWPPHSADPSQMATPRIHESLPDGISAGYLSELQVIMERGGPIGIFLKDTENKYLWVNHAFAQATGFELEDFIGRRVENVISDPEIMATLRKQDDYIYSTGKPLFNLMIPKFNNQSGYYRLDKIPFINRNGELVGIIGLAVEVKEPRPPVEALKQELLSTSKKLQETETALRVLIERRGQDVSLTREELGAKVKDLVVPYLVHLKQTKLMAEQVEFVDLIEMNLKNFYDPGYARLSSPTYNLSPTELKVAQLIRDGKTNKEIAQLLHLSKSTILTHRHHIRAKLGSGTRRSICALCLILEPLGLPDLKLIL